jgi:hypothetical protein
MCLPVANRSRPYFKVASLLGSEWKSLKDFDEAQAFAFTLHRPRGSFPILRCWMSSPQSSESQAALNLFKDLNVVVVQREPKIAVTSTPSISRNIEATFAVNKPCEPMSEGVIHDHRWHFYFVLSTFSLARVFTINNLLPATPIFSVLPALAILMFAPAMMPAMI